MPILPGKLANFLIVVNSQESKCEGNHSRPSRGRYQDNSGRHAWTANDHLHDTALIGKQRSQTNVQDSTGHVGTHLIQSAKNDAGVVAQSLAFVEGVSFIDIRPSVLHIVSFWIFVNDVAMKITHLQRQFRLLQKQAQNNLIVGRKGKEKLFLFSAYSSKKFTLSSLVHSLILALNWLASMTLYLYTLAEISKTQEKELAEVSAG